MMDLLNPKHAAKAYEIEYTLCFDWWFILFFFLYWVYNTMGCVPLSSMKWIHTVIRRCSKTSARAARQFVRAPEKKVHVAKLFIDVFISRPTARFLKGIHIAWLKSQLEIFFFMTLNNKWKTYKTRFSTCCGKEVIKCQYRMSKNIKYSTPK